MKTLLFFKCAKASILPGWVLLFCRYWGDNDDL